MRNIVLLVTMIVLFGCVNPPQPQPNNTYIPPILNNATTIPTTSQPLSPDYTVNLGDRIWVNYTLWVDGKVYDTTNATLANESGIYNPRRNYEPFSFTVEFNEGVIDGFVISVIGVKVNETVTFAVDPQRGYGLTDPRKIITIPRYYNKSLYENVSRAALEADGINITNGTGYDTPYGTVFISDFNDENVTLFYLLQNGTQFTVNGIPQRVVSMSNLSATIEFILEQNNSYILPHPVTGERTLFRVVNKTDDNIILDSNHPLANKTLQFRVTLLKVERPQ